MKQTRLEFHAVANIFPMMTETETESLRQDIAKNGLREPIWIYKNQIIDGRNRYLACLEIGVKPKFKSYDGAESDLIDFVISLNLHRRHLNTSQKSCLAVEILPELEKRTKEIFKKKISNIRKGKQDENSENLNSSQTASKIFGVSERYIFDAKKLLKLSSELFNEVRAGNLTLQKALKQLKESEKTAKLQKSEIVSTLELTKIDLKKVNELVNELGITEQKAKEYILKRKKVKTVSTSKMNKELKIRISPEHKDKIQQLAKQKNTSLSEVIRELLSNL